MEAVFAEMYKLMNSLESGCWRFTRNTCDSEKVVDALSTEKKNSKDKKSKK